MTPAGTINYFDPNTWSMVEGLVPTYQGPLFGFGSYQLSAFSDLALGNHTFGFAIDMDMNGSPDISSLYYDIVDVEVVSGVGPARSPKRSGASLPDQGTGWGGS